MRTGSIKDAFEIAKQKSTIPDWEPCCWNRGVGGSIITGSIPVGIYTKGPKKGEKKWKPVPDFVIVTDAEVDSRVREYEASTGSCHKCKGTGQEWCGWSAKEGAKHRTCTQCDGSGKPTETSS